MTGTTARGAAAAAPGEEGRRRWRLADALAAIPAGAAVPYATVFTHGSMSLEIYAPAGRDNQRPHEQDEVYLVQRGEGAFVNGTRRHPFAAGDALFVPAGRAHRFEDFSSDLAVWVVFYGEAGGEVAAPHPPSAAALRWPLAAGRARIPEDAALRSIPVFEHGTLTLKLYNPRKADPQKPHTRDELYLIAAGAGRFLCGGRSTPFAAGDALFARAGAVHRFADFGAELLTWVVFWGRQGGEG